MKQDLRTRRTYNPPRPEQLPIPLLATRLLRDDQRGWTTGYPAWGLQYYACLCSLKWDRPNVLVETGTNTGCSAALLAQTLIETGLDGHLHTFELDETLADKAQALFEEAGVAERITLWRGDSLKTLPEMLASNPQVDFAFVDSAHATAHCLAETQLLFDAVIKGEGKFYFDNTACGPVDVAIHELKQRYGAGGWVEFLNCSGVPNGQVIWQPWQKPFPTEYYDSKHEPTQHT